MPMKNHAVVLACLLVLFALPALAHQPRIVGGETSIAVEDPEVSKAYYAELHGSPVKYSITSGSPFHLYVNVLIPDIKGIEKNVSAKIVRDGLVIYTLDGSGSGWLSFFEEFAGDNYFKGPEYSKNVPAGNYEILVYSPGNRGKYVLAIGDKEEFPPKEILNTIISLPRLKMYMGKSPFTAYFNRIGVFLLPVIILILVIILVFSRGLTVMLSSRRS